MIDKKNAFLRVISLRKAFSISTNCLFLLYHFLFHHIMFQPNPCYLSKYHYHKNNRSHLKRNAIQFFNKYATIDNVIKSAQPKIIKFLPCLWFHSVTLVSSSSRGGFSPVFIATGFSALYRLIPSMIKISETNNEITK